jgi:hypothetical protein
MLRTCSGCFSRLSIELCLRSYRCLPSGAYSYTPTYPAVLTIVHSDGTLILSLHNSGSGDLKIPDIYRILLRIYQLLYIQKYLANLS